MEYDRFQKEAIQYINEGFSVIVSAPTGAGKTAIAEYIIKEALDKNQRVIYTAPLKALSNQKFRDFNQQFKDKVGILTGDVSINPLATVLIMTTEIFRNKIINNPDELKNYSWVIFDEVHFIDNEERGTVWEEALIFLPKHMKVLCLSATIPNIEEFTSWIESIHKKPLKIVVENKRPVPLKFFFQCQNQILESLKDLKTTGYSYVKEYKPNRLSSLINYLRNNYGLPCIYFVFSRKKTEDLAFELYRFDFLNQKEKKEIISLYQQLCQRLDLIAEESSQRLYHLIAKGIAYHHAGMLPTLKEVVEQLFTTRLIKIIFTTETFALGINMPARSVIFDDLKKFYGRYTRILKVRDFYQMAGRAGRRGIDKQGEVFLRINPHRIGFDDVRRIIYEKPEDIKSQFNLCYATILNLYERYQEGIFKVYPLSLHYFQSKKQKHQEAIRLLQAKLNLLKELGYIKDNHLTPKAKFSSALYGYELILGELYEKNLLEQLDEGELAILSTAIVFEPRKNQHLRRISKRAEKINEICQLIIKQIKQKEMKYRIYPLSKEPYFHLAASAEAWIKGFSFHKILEFTDTDEGELIRYFRMAIQILREIKDSYFSSPLLKEKTAHLISLINRDIVDAEKQLRL
ncbi:MAG: DEAD/DEAH box helicase [Candidatus Omnitrophica bacterium]|nr:DEAD/DEAH box helicase [Candidatus Omnitrophota bacterium]